MDINYTLTENNLHIENSYLFSKREMGVILSELRNIYMEDHFRWWLIKVWRRSDFSLRMEWVCHNFLYSIGYKRERTKDVDLNADCKIEWLYKVLGCLVWVFVK